MKAVFASVMATASATQLSLTWSDCGAGATHAKITGFTPSSLTLGQQTRMTGTGQLDESVSGAKFDLVMNGAIGKLLTCDGDASQSKTCSLPLGVGSLTFDAMKFPLAAGSVPVNVDINLAASLPSSLATTKTTCKATASNGDDLFCIEIDSKPQSRIPAKIAKLEEQSGVSQLALTWSDCGAGATHAKISDFSPSSLTLGKKTTMTGTGQLDEAVKGATFDLVMNGAIGQLLKCDGDASQSKTCQLPLGVGSLTFDAMNFPLAAGNVPVNVDIALSATLPSSLTVTKTTCKATSNSGDDLFCIEINSAPAMTIIV